MVQRIQISLVQPVPWTGRRISTFRRVLLRWYDSNRRELPWRSDPSPYRVWISEIMLQQTQVRTVIPYYDRFLAHFPDIQALAAARESEILALWAGLGYYSRARNLWRAAKIIAEEHSGTFPGTLDSIWRLPGIGRYTACAIRSIAFNQVEPVVDGNVKRVVSRLHGLMTYPGDKFFWDQADAWVSRERPSDFNQAVMELGALVCVPVRPRCAECPVRSLCAARRTGAQDRIPVARRNRRETEDIEVVVLVVSRQNEVLVSRQPPGSFIPGEWGLPWRQLARGNDIDAAARRFARKVLGCAAVVRRRTRITHSIVHRRITAHIYTVEANSPVSPALRWTSSPAADLTSSLFKKALG